MRTVFDRIEHQTDARKAGLVERPMIRTTEPSAVGRDRTFNAHERPRPDDFAHYSSGFARAEHGKSANTSCSGVIVEISAEFEIIRFRIFGRTEVLCDVCLRTEKSLFLTAPESDADRAARFYLESGQDPSGFHHDRAARCVVGRPGCRMPRIEVPAHHY